jgi:hypothetical protein
MCNYIRACFCLPKLLQESQLQELLMLIKVFECVSIDKPTINEDYWVEQKLMLNTSVGRWNARFLQVYFGINKFSTFFFDVDENIFLPGRQIAYSPNQDAIFVQYKHILGQIIRGINPIIGEIDYDADLICALLGNKYPYSIASWGNYFSSKWLILLSPESIGELLDIVDEVIPIDDMGVLTFIHPMQANRAWSNRHKKVEEIIRENMNF